MAAASASSSSTQTSCQDACRSDHARLAANADGHVALSPRSANGHGGPAVRRQTICAGLVLAMAPLSACTATARNGQSATLPRSSSPPTSMPTTPTSTTPTTTAPSIASNIKVYGNCTTPSVEPPEIVLTCADYGELLEGLHWTSWTSAGATAVGTLVYNDCKPNCASGQHHQVPGTVVTLGEPVRGADGQIVWSTVQENPEPPGYVTGPYHGGPQPLPTRPI